MPVLNLPTTVPDRRELVRENSWFFALFGLFLLIGGLLLLQIQTGDDIFFFSERRSAFGDWFFRWFTTMGEAWIYFPIAFLLLFLRFRQGLTVPFIGGTVMVITYGLKSFFAHDRPLAFLSKEGLFGMVHTVSGVDLHGGANSFPSGHTASAFALYTFAALCLPYKKGVAALLFFVALLTGISRIYLVQHFLKDVYAGAMLGFFIGLCWYIIQESVVIRSDSWLNRSLLDLRS